MPLHSNTALTRCALEIRCLIDWERFQKCWDIIKLLFAAFSIKCPSIPHHHRALAFRLRPRPPRTKIDLAPSSDRSRIFFRTKNETWDHAWGHRKGIRPFQPHRKSVEPRTFFYLQIFRYIKDIEGHLRSDNDIYKYWAGRLFGELCVSTLTAMRLRRDKSNTQETT